MKRDMNSILKEVLQKIEPPKKEFETIGNSLKGFVEKIEKTLKTLKIDAEVFVGGSFAKKTLIKKLPYDIDIFIRFDKKYKNQDISETTEKILKLLSENRKNVHRVHGSRDYFRIKINSSLFFEIIPVIKIKTPKEAENITDLSCSHVKYIKKKIKSEEILKDIKLSKVFCYANNCYGAESYIGGFSGYALELLIYYYGGFLRFIKSMANLKDSKDKLIIDIEKHHINKQRVLMDLKTSKLHSPIILIDPTYKHRNVVAALSEETFNDFKKTCKKFLKNPSMEFFQAKTIDFQKIKKQALKKGYEFILLETKTDRQKGDIAGSKLLKFYKHLESEIREFFEIKNKGFSYEQGKSAKYFFVVKNKKEILIQGPNTKDKKNLQRFKKKHKKTFVKNKKIYSKKKIDFDIEKFIKDWKKKNSKRFKEMSITDLKIVKD